MAASAMARLSRRALKPSQSQILLTAARKAYAAPAASLAASADQARSDLSTISAGFWSSVQQRGFSYVAWSSPAVSRFIATPGFGRSYSTGISNYPAISDPDVKSALKELMAWGWDEIPNSVISDVQKALSKNTEDKAGQQSLANVFRAAEASVEFTALLVNIRMALEERTGMTGENVEELPEELVNAITLAYNRYITYVHSFGAEETFLRKKVEAELGTRLIHLKQRVSGLGSEWGEINVIGTSGLSGSYVEQRA